MKKPQDELILELKLQIERDKTQVESLAKLPAAQLNYKKESKAWSVLECLEHLNLYGDFYLPEIEEKLSKAKQQQSVKYFKSGMLGNYFANSMLPKEGMIKNKMATFKDKNPSNSNLDISVIDRFLDQQNRWLLLLQKSEKVDMNRVKTAISISKIIKLKLGDTFRFLMNHQRRHLLQATNVLSAMPQQA